MNQSHPCAGKCSAFQNERCNTCLVEQVEKREFELGLAPEEVYVKAADPIAIGEVFEIFGVSTLP